MNKKIKLSIVVPCFNEEEVLPETAKRLIESLKKMVDSGLITEDSYIVFVDDGSRDNTWNIIEALSEGNQNIIGVKLSRNFGHQNAVLAGLEFVKDKCDATISIDADLQDDINVMAEGVELFDDGYEIVSFVRKERKSDSFGKRSTALLFYRLMLLMGVQIVYNHADYRLVGNKALKELFRFREVNLFLRGIFPLIGFKSTTVFYDRQERFAGTSKYPFRKMLAFALDGITSFSVAPLRLIATLGVLVFCSSIVMGGYVLFEKLFGNGIVPGWASTVMPIYLLGGLQIFCTGIVGEYVGKIYKEAKDRPRYIVEEIK